MRVHSLVAGVFTAFTQVCNKENKVSGQVRDLANLCHCDRRSFLKAINIMKEFNIICQITDEPIVTYIINPYVMKKGDFYEETTLFKGLNNSFDLVIPTEYEEFKITLDDVDTDNELSDNELE